MQEPHDDAWDDSREREGGRGDPSRDAYRTGQARPGPETSRPTPPRPPQQQARTTGPSTPPRIVAGGAVLARDLPPRTEDWPQARPLPAKVDAPARSGLLPRADQPRRPDPSKVDTPAEARPAPRPAPGSAPGTAPNRADPSKVDAPARRQPVELGTAPSRQAPAPVAPPDPETEEAETFEIEAELPKPTTGPAPARTPMAARPSVAPIPGEELLRVVRDARKNRLAAGAAATPALVGAGPTRTPGTVDDYRNRGNQLLKRFQRERRQPIDALGFVPRDFAFWLLSLRQGLKASTWRVYRQSAIMLLSGFPNEEAQAAIELIENDAPGEREMDTGDAPPPGALPSERMTSARKRKHFRYDEWQRIEAHVRLKNRSETAYILLDWLRAGLATGLRPGEWKATEISHHVVDGVERTYLFVLNAKATNGRGNGAVRTLDLTALSDGAIATIERMSHLGLKAFREGRFDQLQSNCSQILYQTCHKLWPRRENHYALYSCRHQFMANMKALGLPNEEVSALAGHVVDETAAQNYGRKSVGWPADKIEDRPRGVKDEIATVRRRLVLWEERQALVTVAKHGPGETPLPPLPVVPSQINSGPDEVRPEI